MIRQHTSKNVPNVSEIGETSSQIEGEESHQSTQFEHIDKCFKAAVEGSAASIVVTGIDGSIQYVNPAFEEQTGYTKEDSIGNNPRLLKSEYNDPQIYKELWATISSGKVWKGNLVNKRKDGSTYWESIRINPVFSDKGDITQFVAVKYDISELKHTESQRRWMALLLDYSPNICVMRDLENRILAFNKKYFDATGLEDSEAIYGKLDTEIFGDEHTYQRASFLTLLDKAKTLNEGDSINTEIKHTYPDGVFFVFNIQAFPIRDNFGTIIATGTIATDITHLKKKTDELQATLRELEIANHAKSRFIATVSHELRTPLNAILGLSSLMLDSDTISDECRENMTSIFNSSENLKDQIERLLEFGLLKNKESGRSKVETIDPINWLNQMVAEYLPLMNSKNLELIHQISDNVPKLIEIDTYKLSLVLSNLLSNAVKYTDRGYIKLSVEIKNVNEESRLIFRVKDTGKGITVKHQKQIFEAFYQEDQSNQRSYQGIGLGLSIAKEATLELMGDLALEFSDDTGSIFRLELPVNLNENHGTEAPKGIPITNDTLTCNVIKVLVADDIQMNLTVAQKLLQKFGCSVDFARNGFEVIEKIENDKYDLLLLDLQMPEMDGYTAMMELSNKGETEVDLPIIAAMTASVDNETLDKCKAVGFNDHLPKPIKLSDMESLLLRHF